MTKFASHRIEKIIWSSIGGRDDNILCSKLVAMNALIFFGFQIVALTIAVLPDTQQDVKLQITSGRHYVNVDTDGTHLLFYYDINDRCRDVVRQILPRNDLDKLTENHLYEAQRLSQGCIEIVESSASGMIFPKMSTASALTGVGIGKREIHKSQQGILGILPLLTSDKLVDGVGYPTLIKPLLNSPSSENSLEMASWNPDYSYVPNHNGILGVPTVEQFQAMNDIADRNQPRDSAEVVAQPNAMHSSIPLSVQDILGGLPDSSDRPEAFNPFMPTFVVVGIPFQVPGEPESQRHEG